MSVTVTTYSRDHNYKIDLTIEGTTPTELTLAGIEIRYPEVEAVYPLIYPNFSFKFLGTKDLYEQFGRIEYDTHAFTLSSANGHTFKGYLTPEVFSMPNTGFDEYFVINAVSAIENLKNIPFDTDAYGDTVSIAQLITDIFTQHAGITQPPVITKVFSGDMGSVNTLNFINDDDEHENLFTVLEWIGEAFLFKFILNFDNTVSVFSLAHLAAAGGGDYVAVKHYGIDETYSVGEIFDKATVIVSDYEQPQIPVDFALKDPGGGNIPMEVRQGKRYAISKVGSYYTYERYISYFKSGESPWRFPKYKNINSYLRQVDEFDEAQIFNNGVPVLGAYPIAWRSYASKESDAALSAPLQFALLIKNFDGNNYNIDGLSGGSHFTIMEYVGNSFAAEDDSFMFFTFDYGFTTFRGDPNGWNDGWADDYDGTGEMERCPVPISPNHSTETLNSYYLLQFSVKFRGKYWNDVSKNWVDGQTWFQMMPNRAVIQNNFASVKDYPPPGGKPFYEDVSGYWMGFKGNSGLGQLTVAVQVKPAYTVQSYSYWLKNFNIKFIQSVTAAGIISPRQDTVYTNTSTSKFEYPKITVRLASKNESHASRSRLLAGDTVIDAYNYLLPTGGGGTFSIREKPEYHIIRMVTQYISRIKSIVDILDVDSFAWTRTYHGNRLWCDSLKYDIIDDTIQCKYYYNDINYSVL